jgi:mannose-6-phosphate isomerase
MTSDLYPLLFEPVYKDYLWSGTRLAKRYPRAVPNGRCAESWEVADRPEGMSVVKSGPLAGARLDELVSRFGKSLVGNSWKAGPFPLLVKIIDAGEKLSVQVHPDDANAGIAGGQAKTEMWYALDGAPDAAVYLGFSTEVSGESFAAALAASSVEPLLMKHRVSAGDAFYVPGGAVHAIGAGCLLLEVQQNSNTTYRVYDWGRVDAKTGRPRDLHVENAMKVIRWTAPAPQPIVHQAYDCGPNPHRILKSPHFSMDRFDASRPFALKRNGGSFDILFAADGTVRVTAGSGHVDMQAGTSCLVPAALPDCRLEPAGHATILRIAMPAQ